MAGRIGERHLLRSCSHQVRHASLPAPIAELPGCLSEKRHLLLPRGAKSCTARSSGVARSESAEQPQDTHQRPGRQVRWQPKDIKVALSRRLSKKESEGERERKKCYESYN